MNSHDLIQSFNYIGEDLVDEAEYGQFPARHEKPQPATRRTFRRPLLVAALVALLLLLVGCTIAYVLSLQSLQLGSQEVSYDAFDPDTLEYLGKETYTEEVFTVSGLEGTPGYLASKEWFDFRQSYDPDRAIQGAVWGNYPEFPAQYDAYGLYSQEMKDKVDEILKKYNLKPVGAQLEFRTLRNMLAALGIEKFQTAENDVTTNVTMGYCYENGNFGLSLDFSFPEAAETEVTTTWGNLRWNRADCFSDDLFAIQQALDWKEWNYKTASGTEVLIIRSDSDWRGWILCNRPDGILSLQVETRQDLWYNEDSKTWAAKRFLTDAQIEQLADAIDFGIQPRVATREDVANEPDAPMEATQDGYTLKLKSVETDGWVARIVLSITAPEGTVISRNTAPGFEEDHLGIGPTNLDNWGPKIGRETSSSGGWNPEEDGDGLDNTQDLVMEAICSMEDGSAPFASGKTWVIHFEDLVSSYWDSSNSKFVEETLATGEWNFEVTFDDSNGDYREVELLTEPVTAGVSVGWKPDGTDVTEDVTIHSVKLRKFSLTITHDGPEHADFSYINGQRLLAVMKDGSELEFSYGTGTYQVYGEIDFEQLAYIQLPDGTRIPGPQ